MPELMNTIMRDLPRLRDIEAIYVTVVMLHGLDCMEARTTVYYNYSRLR
jgi:hypothetical protein